MFFKPNQYKKDVGCVDWKSLYQKGKRVIVFDLDNTLDIPDKETKKLDDNLDKLLKDLKQMGYTIFVFSNNKEFRVSSFAKHVDFECISDANKPFLKKYKLCFSQYNKNELVFVGDKIVTDVIGGNLFRSYTILVDPLTEKKKYWYTKFMSFWESVFRTIIGFKKGNYYE